MPTKNAAKKPLVTALHAAAAPPKKPAPGRPGASTNRHRPSSDKSPRGGTPGGPAPATGSPGRGRRTSVNVFDADLNALEPLRVYLRAETGLRVIRDSTLVQVACRVFAPGPAAVAALREVLAADGRH